LHGACRAVFRPVSDRSRAAARSGIRLFLAARPGPVPQNPAPSRKFPIRLLLAVYNPENNRPANRVFSDVAAAADACRTAWERFAAPNRVASVVRREWAVAPVPAQTGYSG